MVLQRYQVVISIINGMKEKKHLGLLEQLGDFGVVHRGMVALLGANIHMAWEALVQLFGKVVIIKIIMAVIASVV